MSMVVQTSAPLSRVVQTLITVVSFDHPECHRPAFPMRTSRNGLVPLSTRNRHITPFAARPPTADAAPYPTQSSAAHATPPTTPHPRQAPPPPAHPKRNNLVEGK